MGYISALTYYLLLIAMSTLGSRTAKEQNRTYCYGGIVIFSSVQIRSPKLPLQAAEPNSCSQAIKQPYFWTSCKPSRLKEHCC